MGEGKEGRDEGRDGRMKDEERRGPVGVIVPVPLSFVSCFFFRSRVRMFSFLLIVVHGGYRRVGE